MAKRLQIRRDSTANWTSNNPILAEGEIAWDTTLEKGKVGDGSTAWSSLPFSIFTQAELDAKAPLSSPALIGVPTAPTASEDTATTQIATTAFVVDQDYVKAATASSLYLTQVAASATYASVSSPTFTGTVTTPQLSVSDGLIVVQRVSSVEEGGEIRLNRSSDNTTGWTIDAFGSTSTPSLRFFDSTNTVRFSIDGSGNAQMTGAPTAPTAAAGTNNTQIATTAFVNTAVSGIGGGAGTLIASGTITKAGSSFDFANIFTSSHSIYKLILMFDANALQGGAFVVPKGASNTEVYNISCNSFTRYYSATSGNPTWTTSGYTTNTGGIAVERDVSSIVEVDFYNPFETNRKTNMIWKLIHGGGPSLVGERTTFAAYAAARITGFTLSAGTSENTISYRLFGYGTL